ncbi:MAG: RNA polymerase sigma factor [Bacteroidetes bacterium]|nr:MAG: RNA polymerase sigma factor [Bacteroidota bacterium]
MSKYVEDEQLLQQLRRGLEADWRRFYEQERSAFRLYFLKYTQLQPQDVRTLYQDALVVLHRKISRGELVAPLRSSLRTYLIGIGKMLYRKQWQQQAKQWEDEIPELAQAPSIEAQHEQQAAAEQVRRLLGQLDTGCREILTLVYLRGYAMDAVQETLGLPSVGAARKRKFDCLRRLRQLL